MRFLVYPFSELDNFVQRVSNESTSSLVIWCILVHIRALVQLVISLTRQRDRNIGGAISVN
jgi:hypothetical protein